MIWVFIWGLYILFFLNDIASHYQHPMNQPRFWWVPNGPHRFVRVLFRASTKTNGQTSEVWKLPFPKCHFKGDVPENTWPNIGMQKLYLGVWDSKFPFFSFSSKVTLRLFVGMCFFFLTKKSQAPEILGCTSVDKCGFLGIEMGVHVRKRWGLLNDKRFTLVKSKVI